MSGFQKQILFFSIIFCLCASLSGVVSADGGNTTLAQPDLVITIISPNDGEIFAHEPNLISATVKNSGTGSSGTFNVRFRINGVDSIVPTTGLAPGTTAQVSSTDTASRLNGASVSVNVMADPEGTVNETDKTNNALEVKKTVLNNGYKGKRFTDGSDMNTKATFSLRGDLICSAKAEYQGSGNWGSKTVTWSAADTPVPSGVSVKDVRLYVPYNWDGDKIMPGGVTMSFNGNSVTPVATYSDTKGYGGYDYPSGLMVYSVASQFSTSGSNAATITRTSSLKGPSLNGMILVVMYEDNTKTQKVIFLNEEADILKRYESDTWISPEEATAYATFTGASIDLSRVASARLITIANSAKPGEGNLIFNGQTWTGVWTGGDDSTFGIDDRSVTNSLISSGNGVQFKAGVTGDYFMPSNAILIVEYTGLLQTTQTTVTTITTTTTSAIGNSNSTANGNSNVTGTGNSTSTITFAPTKKINPQSAVTVSGEDSASGVKDNGNTDESDTGNGRQSSEITGNQDQAETRSSTSSSDILIPLPLAVVGAVVLVNSILAVIGLLLIVNDLKIGK